MRKRILAPSILAADCSVLGEQVKTVTEAGAQYVHIDVMDGVFVPSLSFGIPIVSTLRKVTDAIFDVHLMLVHPSKYVDEFAKAGADSITFHLASEDDPSEVIKLIRKAGCKVGISIKPGTPVEDVEPYLGQVDMLLIMTVEPGFGGQKYIAESTMRIAQARAYIDSHALQCDIEVDGGIADDTCKTVLEVGANVIVAGSAIFKGNLAENVKHYLKLLEDVPVGQVL